MLRVRTTVGTCALLLAVFCGLGLLAPFVFADAATEKAPTPESPWKLIVTFLGMGGSAVPPPRQDELFVVGAGIGRTGTSSMLLALKELGLKSYHMKDGVIDLNHNHEWAQWARAKSAVLRGDVSVSAKNALERETNNLIELLAVNGFNATLDAPAFLLYKELAAKYPKAKVILTVRKSAREWAESYIGTVGRLNPFWHKFPFNQLQRFVDFDAVVEMIYEGTGIVRSNNTEVDLDNMMKGYLAWNAEVIKTIPKERLLVHEASQGWKPLCDFLQVKECPTTPYPRVNDGATIKIGLNALDYIARGWWILLGFIVFTPLFIIRKCCFGKSKSKAKKA